MTRTCPSCFNSNPSDHSYCHQCGTALGAAARPESSPLPIPAAVVRRPADESRLPPAGSFRSGLYRLLRALFINQGVSAYKEHEDRGRSRDEEPSPRGAVLQPAPTPPSVPADDPALVATRRQRLSGGPPEPLQAAAYWLSRAFVARYLPRARRSEPATSALRAPTPGGDIAAGNDQQAIGRGWGLPGGIRERASNLGNRVGAPLEGLRQWSAADSELSVPRHVEVAVVAVLTLAAVFLRMWNLDAVPNGVHGDETAMALEAIRSVQGGDLGIWTGVTLGHPAGYTHWMALIFRIGGADVTTMRLASAIPGVLLVPVGYLLVRSLFPFRVAALTTTLLVFSFWFVIQSRIAFGAITGVFMAMLAMWLLVAAFRSGRNWVAVIAGVALGLGLYSFKTFLIYFISIWGVVLLSMVVERELRNNRQLWLALGVSVLVGAPMLLFYATSDFIGANLSDLYHVSLGSPETWARIPGLALDAILLVHLSVEGNTTDGAPAIPILPVVAASLFWVGLTAIALRVNRRRYLLLLAGWLVGMSPVLLVPGVESRRYLLGMFFVLLIVAIGVDTLLPPACRWIRDRLGGLRLSAGAIRRAVLATAVILPVVFAALFAEQNLREVSRWRDSESVRWFFSSEYHEALLFLRDLDGVNHVRLYSARHSVDSSMRRFVLPGASGVDGSLELGGYGELPDRGELHESTVFLFMDEYLSLAGELEQEFPDAVKLGEKTEGAMPLYSMYLVARN